MQVKSEKHLEEYEVHTAIDEYIKLNKCIPSTIKCGYLVAVMLGWVSASKCTASGMKFVTPIGELGVVVDPSVESNTWELA